MNSFCTVYPVRKIGRMIFILKKGYRPRRPVDFPVVCKRSPSKSQRVVGGSLDVTASQRPDGFGSHVKKAV